MGNIQAAPEKFLDPLVSTYVRVCAGEGCKSPAPLVHTCLVVQHKNNALCKAPSPSLTCGKGAIVHVLMRRQQLGS